MPKPDDGGYALHWVALATVFLVIIGLAMVLGRSPEPPHGSVATRYGAPCYPLGDSWSCYLSDDRRGHHVEVQRSIPGDGLHRVAVQIAPPQSRQALTHCFDFYPSGELRQVSVSCDGVDRFLYYYSESGALQGYTIWEPHAPDAKTYKGRFLRYDDMGRPVGESEVKAVVHHGS